MKFTSLRASWRQWVIGIALAVVGVIIARLVSPHYTGKTQVALLSAGRLTSFAGLIVIVFAVNRRIKRESEENSPS